MRLRSVAGRLEAGAQAVRELAIEGREVESPTIAEREQAARVQHPLLEAERRSFTEALRIARDPPRERLELLVPFRAEEDLVDAVEEPDPRQLVEIARLEQEHTAVLAGADALGAQPPP